VRFRVAVIEAGEPHITAVAEHHGSAVEDRLYAARAKHLAAAIRQCAGENGRGVEQRCRADLHFLDAHRFRPRAAMRLATCPGSCWHAAAWTGVWIARPATNAAAQGDPAAAGSSRASRTPSSCNEASPGLIWWPATQCGHHAQIVKSSERILTRVSLLVSIAVTTSSLVFGHL
jgi:hypothetical protein